MRLSAQPFLWKWVLFAWEWKIISISKAEDLTSFWYRGLGNSEMAYLGTLPSDRGGDTCRLFGVVGCVPDESTRNLGSQVSLLRTVLKGIKKAEEERWKERRAKHSVSGSLPELKLLQLSWSCAGWVIQSMSLAQIAFPLGFIRIYSIFATNIPTSFASAAPPPPLPGILKEYALRQI